MRSTQDTIEVRKHSYAEIARELRLSKQRVVQIEKKAFSKIAKDPEMLALWEKILDELNAH
jgi:transcriptional regulator